MIRLDKILAHCGYGSRKEVKELIRKGYVLVNGEVVLDDDFKVDPQIDEITVANEDVSYDEFIYLMLNKPDGYVSATFDNNDPTVLDLIYGYENRNLFPVGRLDKDTTGLLLLTNDGKLAHKLLSPKHHVNKTYYVQYKGLLNNNAIIKFKEGIVIDDGYKCLPALLEIKGENEALITIQEGKFHQVKRMFEAVNCNVTYLQRIAFGGIKLDDKLVEGEYRLLTVEEINLLKENN